VSVPICAVDATVARTNLAGSGVYARRLLEALRPALGDRLVELQAPATRAVQGPKRLSDRVRNLVQDLWWTQHEVERAARRAGASMLHVPVSIGPVRARLPLLLTIHDVTVLQTPERFTGWYRRYAGWAMPRSARAATAIITGSHSSRSDIQEWLGVPAERIVVTPYAVPHYEMPAESAIEATRAKFALPPRFVLTVGSIEPRKNLPRLLEAMRQLAAERETSDVSLVHVGPSGWLAGELEATIDRLQLRDRVRFLGYVDAADLDHLYTLATVTAYASLYEGFGLPILEAMARGGTVVTSNVSSMPEVAGDAALLVDPLRPEEIAGAIRRLWTDDALRRELRAKGRARVAHFTPEAMARATIAVYDSVGR
jgi:glycosyltransferase involved in cell wall biosynthesis